MITKAIRMELQEMKDSGIQERSEALHNWLYGERKEAFSEVLTYVALQADLIESLTRELADLRKEESPAKNQFYQMSTPARKRR